MKNIIIAPVGKSIDDLEIVIKDFPVERVILLALKSHEEDAIVTKNGLENRGIATEIRKITGFLWEDIFKIISEIKEIYPGKSMIVVTSTANRTMTCATTSAAFANSLKAVVIEDGQVMLLPIFKFSYQKMLTDKKMDILQYLYENDSCSSLEELSRKIKMSLPLVSYHLNGNLRSEGLKDLGLVETNMINGKTQVKLAVQGKLLVKGYIN